MGPLEQLQQTMLKRFIIGIVLVIPFLCAAQCKYEVNDADPFTKQPRKLTREQILWKHPSGGNSLSFKAGRNGDSMFLQMRYSHKGDVFTVLDGSTLMLRVGDSSVVELPCTTGKVADFYTSESMGTVWYVDIEYSIGEDAMQVLRSGMVTFAKFHTKEGYIEKEIKENKQAVISSLVGCL